MSPDEPDGSLHQPAPLSRRRLLVAGLAGAAGVALPWGGRAASAGSPRGGNEKLDKAYQELFLRALYSDERVRVFDQRGQEFLYRPKQILVLAQDVGRVLDKLRSQGYEVRAGERVGKITLLEFYQDVDIPKVVTMLREQNQWPGAEVPRVQPNHVTVGTPVIMGNPDGAPVAATEMAYPGGTAGKGVTVGICDTGIWAQAGSRHPNWLGGAFTPEADDVDGLSYGFAAGLAAQAGHGTFVAGVVRQAAPGARFDPEVALNPAGYGDELTLAAAISDLGTVDILNLSLGYWSMGDLEPLISTVFAPGTVVVASAGNTGADRPMWPGACSDVVVVAAVAPDPKAPLGVARTSYSSYGAWVDACAYGTRVSTYVTGTMDLPTGDRLAYEGWARWAGTSFTAPHVAGTLAKLMTVRGISAQQARAWLLRPGQPQVPGCGVLVL